MQSAYRSGAGAGLLRQHRVLGELVPSHAQLRQECRHGTGC